MNFDNILQREGNTLLIVNYNDLRELVRDVSGKAQTTPAQQMVINDAEQPISQQEATRFLGKSRQTLLAWRKKGYIKAYHIGGRIYYKPSELLTALKEC